MTKNESSEFDTFNSAMDTILAADPKAVKQAMEGQKQEKCAERSVNRTLADGFDGVRLEG